MITHILGMAKSSLSLKGAKGPKLELDFLKLAYAISRLKLNHENAQGFLLVLAEQPEDRARTWISKYGMQGLIDVIRHPLSAAEHEILLAEKVGNVQGMVAGTIGQDVGGRSSGLYGKRLGEQALRDHIHAKFPGLRDLTLKPPLPLGIFWDFYGTITSGDSTVT